MNDKVNHKLLKASGIAALILAAAALICGILELCVLGMRNSLDYLDAGKRWSRGQERYAVVGMYTEAAAGISPDQAMGWVRSVDAGLLEASVTPKEGGRPGHALPDCPAGTARRFLARTVPRDQPNRQRQREFYRLLL